MTGEGRSRQVLAGGLAVKARCIAPTPLMPARSGTASHVRLVRIVLPFRKAGVTTDNTTTRTIVPASPPPGIMHNPKGNAMAQTPHPLDVILEDLWSVRADLVKSYLRTGKTIDGDQRYVLDRIDRARTHLLMYRRKQVAGVSFERNGDSDLTRRRFNEAGYTLRRIERDGPKIIKFPDRAQHTG